MPMFARKNWKLVGIFCEHHLPMAIRSYGTVRVLTLESETLPLDTTCNILQCRDKPCFHLEQWA